MSQDWEKMLRKKMEDYSELPPENLWEDLENELFPEEEKKQFVFLKPTQLSGNKSYLNIVFRAAAVVLIVLSAKSIITFPSKSIHYTKAETNEVALPKPTFKPTLDTKGKSFISRKESFGSKTEPKVETEFLEKPKNKEESIFDLPEPLKPLLATKETRFSLPTSLDVAQEVFSAEKRKKKWVASVLAGQVASTASHQNSGYTSMSSTPLGAYTTALGNSVLTILERTSKEDISTKIKHRSPIQFGVGVQYPLSEKLTINSGLLYTKLVSELESGSDSKYINSVQTLHYLGVPLQMNYTFFEKKKLSAYSSIGVTAEKNIGGKVENHYRLKPIIEEVSTKKIEDKSIQLSANLLVGVQFKINNNVGIYLEPGFHYYVPNSSKAATLYNEKPFLVNTRMGLRFTLNN